MLFHLSLVKQQDTETSATSDSERRPLNQEAMLPDVTTAILSLNV